MLTSGALLFCDFWSWLQITLSLCPPLLLLEVRAVDLRPVACWSPRRQQALISCCSEAGLCGAGGGGLCQTSSRCGHSYLIAWLWLRPAASRLLLAEPFRKTKPSDGTRGPTSWKAEKGVAGLAHGPRPREPGLPSLALSLGWSQPSAGCLLGGSVSQPTGAPRGWIFTVYEGGGFRSPLLLACPRWSLVYMALICGVLRSHASRPAFLSQGCLA